MSFVLVVGCGGSDNRKTEVIKQPIQFNHKQHTVVEEMDCIECHQHFETSPASGIPSIEICADCHGDGSSESPEGIKVDELVDNEEEIPWVRMYQLPDHIFFDHSAHIRGEVECKTCHLGTGTAEKPTRYRDFGDPDRWLDFRQREKTMNWCMDCHQESNANLDCLVCHQ